MGSVKAGDALSPAATIGTFIRCPGALLPWHCACKRPCLFWQREEQAEGGDDVQLHAAAVQALEGNVPKDLLRRQRRRILILALAALLDA